MNQEIYGATAFQRFDRLFFQEQLASNLVKIGRFELSTIHRAPNIYVIEDFLTTSDLKFLNQTIQTRQRQFERSYVDRTEGNDSQYNNSYGSSLDEQRTSSFLSFHKQENAYVNAIETRAAELFGQYSTEQIEPLQLVRYKPSQFFGVHHDMGDFNEDTLEVELPKKNVLVKRRIATIFCYLNDLPSGAGGCTFFPACGNLRVQPKKGRAVVFSNVTQDGMPDKRLIHAGETVIGEGYVLDKEPPTKYGLNIWICEK